MKLQCIHLELADGTIVELKGKYNDLNELKVDIVHRIFNARLGQETSRGGALLQTTVDCGYQSTNAIEYILKQSAP